MLKRFVLPVAAAVAMTGFLVPQAVAEEPAAASQCEMVQVIESGTLKWGVKQSYRQYIFNKSEGVRCFVCEALIQKEFH
ncbi:hypothetical protein FRC0493_00603 [Corynebacterium diphtheriae]|nr:hypothetical protein FRC0493_00603 [Corynebacterium diphtheriae]